MNLNWDEINCFRAETDPDRSWIRGATWAKSFKLKDMSEKLEFGEN